jgi:hypothetical protein
MDGPRIARIKVERRLTEEAANRVGEPPYDNAEPQERTYGEA